MVGRDWYEGYGLYGAGGAMAGPPCCGPEIEPRALGTGPALVGECWVGEG